jgi:hypothetical protein
MDFISEPIPISPKNYNLSEEHNQILWEEIQTMISKKAVEECFNNQGIYSPMFVTIQKANKLRPIWDGKYINSFHKKQHFQMEGLLTVKDLLQRGDYMTKIDIKDAYFHIPFAPQHQNYLRFYFKGRMFRFLAMNFGLTSAPRIFTKIMKNVVSILRSKVSNLLFT